MDRQLTDVVALAGHLIPAGSMFAFLAEHRAEVFPDADYADLFAPPGSGRPSAPAAQLAAVMTLQALHDRRPGRHLPRPPAQAPLPRVNQEQRLAQAPDRRTEPAQPDRQGLTWRAGGWALAT